MGQNAENANISRIACQPGAEVQGRRREEAEKAETMLRTKRPEALVAACLMAGALALVLLFLGLAGCASLRIERSALTRETAFRIESEPSGALVEIWEESEAFEKAPKVVPPFVHPRYVGSPSLPKDKFGRHYYTVKTPFVEGPGELGVIVGSRQRGVRRQMVWTLRVSHPGYETQVLRILARDLPATLRLTLAPLGGEPKAAPSPDKD